MNKSIQTWRNLIAGKSAFQIAETLQQELVGYRKTSLHRATDADSIANLLIAIDPESFGGKRD